MPKENTGKKPWYDSGLSFECTQCGACCTGPPGVVWFTEEEGRAMAGHLGMTEAEFKREYAEKRLGKWSLKDMLHPDRGYDCVFLRFDPETQKAGCSIYPVRPAQCRTWPFWPSNLESRRSWERAAKGCPGMRQGGKFYPVEQIRIIASQNNDAL